MADLREVEQFLFHEAALLDNRKFDEWLELYPDDALYWVKSHCRGGIALYSDVAEEKRKAVEAEGSTNGNS